MSNPYSKLLLSKEMQNSMETVKRVDDKGRLYEMEFTGKYDGIYSLPIKAIKLVKKGGCSAFLTHTENKGVITARNYDLPHKSKDGSVYGVNFVIKTNPEGKYKSICGADSVWLSTLGIKTYEGCFDDGKTKLTALCMLPYLCMDGMNEKGFTCSILALDVKDGEKPVAQNEKGKKKVIITVLLRYLLDNCKDVKEAIEYAQKYNLVNTLGKDYHLFITDAKGKYAVLEWRNNQFRAVDNDCVTNCYVGDDDAKDCYYGEALKEKFVPLKKKTTKEYHFGYGHGYERYKTLVKFLDSKIDKTSKQYKTIMSKEEAMKLLSKVAQDYTGEVTSFTQYSVIYDNKKLTACYAVMQDYKKLYSFNL